MPSSNIISGLGTPFSLIRHSFVSSLKAIVIVSYLATIRHKNAFGHPACLSHFLKFVYSFIAGDRCYLFSPLQLRLAGQDGQLDTGRGAAGSDSLLIGFTHLSEPRALISPRVPEELREITRGESEAQAMAGEQAISRVS